MWKNLLSKILFYINRDQTHAKHKLKLKKWICLLTLKYIHTYIYN